MFKGESSFSPLFFQNLRRHLEPIRKIIVINMSLLLEAKDALLLWWLLHRKLYDQFILQWW